MSKKPQRKRPSKSGSGGKSGRVSIRMVLLSTLRPARINDQIYKPVDPDDPEIQALAQSIRERGLKEDIVASRDGVIMSGHRRRVGCLLAVPQAARRIQPAASQKPRRATA
jgi:hypothetical protein